MLHLVVFLCCNTFPWQYIIQSESVCVVTHLLVTCKCDGLQCQEALFQKKQMIKPQKCLMSQNKQFLLLQKTQISFILILPLCSVLRVFQQSVQMESFPYPVGVKFS